MRRRISVLGLALTLLPAWASACESCSDALAADPAGLRFSEGIYASIIFILGVVFTLVALFVRYVVKEANRKNVEEGNL